jgi:uncharacterized protein DUF3306
MSEAKEPFLERWSRLKTRDRETLNDAPAPEPAAPPAKAEEPPAPLPKIDELTPESDFRPFMNANVDPATRREALKKLFAGDAHFNLPDPFEAYSEDYTGGEPIPPEMLKTLNQAKKLLFDEPDKAAEAAAPEKAEPPAADAKDVAGSKDA